MPKSKRNNPSFTYYFNDFTKLVKIMIILKFKERYSLDCPQAFKEVIKTYVKKNYIRKNKIETIKRTWRCNTVEVKYMYEKVLKCLFEVMLFFSSITETVPACLLKFMM